MYVAVVVLLNISISGGGRNNKWCSRANRPLGSCNNVVLDRIRYVLYTWDSAAQQ